MAITRIGNITNTLPDNSISNSKFTDIVNFKNIIINGDMSIAQRGTSDTGTVGYKSVDRFRISQGAGGTDQLSLTNAQVTDSPEGFAYSNKITISTPETTLNADELFFYEQRIEGQNLQYLKKGTANAESLTLSFWIKGSVTGTYIVNLYDADNVRNIAGSYTIETANTWEKKTLTFAGDTTGAFDNDNAQSLAVWWYLGAGTDYTSGTLQTSWGSYTAADSAVGQTDIVTTSNATWQITGVQLEAGTAASDFEFLPVDVNLQRCERYYNEVISSPNNVFFHMISDDGSYRRLSIPLNPRMRATPTVTITGGTSGTYASPNPTTESVTDNKMLVLKGDVVSNTGSFSYITNLIADAEL